MKGAEFNDDISGESPSLKSSFIVGDLCFRMALRGDETTAPALLAELKKLEAAFTGIPGGEYLPLRLAIEQVETATGDNGA